MGSPVSFTGCIKWGAVDSAGDLVGGMTDAGEVYPLSISTETEQIKVKSRKCTTAGQTIGTKTEITDIVGSISLHEYTARSLAYALNGAFTENTEGAATGETATITAVHDEWVPVEADTPRYNTTNMVVTDNATGLTTYVLNTDYEFDPVLNQIKALSTGSISDSEVLDCEFDVPAGSGAKVTIGTSDIIRVRIEGRLKNEFTGTEQYLHIRSAVLSTASEINFVSEEGSEGEVIELTMSLETPTGFTDPGTIDDVPLT